MTKPPTLEERLRHFADQGFTCCVLAYDKKRGTYSVQVDDDDGTKRFFQEGPNLQLELAVTTEWVDKFREVT